MLITRFSQSPTVDTPSIKQHQYGTYNYGVAVLIIYMIYFHHTSPLQLLWHSIENPAFLDHMRPHIIKNDHYPNTTNHKLIHNQHHPSNNLNPYSLYTHASNVLTIHYHTHCIHPRKIQRSINTTFTTHYHAHTPLFKPSSTHHRTHNNNNYNTTHDVTPHQTYSPCNMERQSSNILHYQNPHIRPEQPGPASLSQTPATPIFRKRHRYKETKWNCGNLIKWYFKTLYVYQWLLVFGISFLWNNRYNSN